MGFGVSDLQLIVALRARGILPQAGAIAEIGAQQMNDSLLNAPDEIAKAGVAFGVKTPPPIFKRSRPPSPNNPLLGAPLARGLWTWLGFDYIAIDLDGSPGSVPLDLNYDNVPPELVGRYHLVTNYGTTEHAANQLQAFKIIHDLAPLGGVMVHNVPGPLLEHGLVNYTFKFFNALARSNGYEIVGMSLSLGGTQSVSDGVVDQLASYDAGARERLLHYRPTGCGIVAVLRKIYELPYVAPLDIPGDAETDNAELLARYPTVFDPNIFLKSRNWNEGLEAVYRDRIRFARWVIKRVLQKIKARLSPTSQKY
jgi:hypothetical protein